MGSSAGVISAYARIYITQAKADVKASRDERARNLRHEMPQPDAGPVVGKPAALEAVAQPTAGVEARRLSRARNLRHEMPNVEPPTQLAVQDLLAGVCLLYNIALGCN